MMQSNFRLYADPFRVKGKEPLTMSNELNSQVAPASLTITLSGRDGHEQGF